MIFLECLSCYSNLFQPLPVIIFKPVSKRFFKAPLKLITAVLQLLATDISRNLELLHSCRTDTHWRAKKHGSPCHRHDNPVRNIRHKLSQSSNLLQLLGSKVEDDIILCRSKRQVLDRLADIILDERRLQLLTITQSWLVILYYRIRSTRLNDVEVIYLGVRIMTIAVYRYYT